MSQTPIPYGVTREEFNQIFDLVSSARAILEKGDALSGSALWRLVDACGLLARLHNGHHAPGSAGQPTGRGFYVGEERTGNLMPLVKDLTQVVEDLLPWANAHADTLRVPLHPPGPLARIKTANEVLARAHGVVL